MKYRNTISGNTRRLTLRIVRSPNSPSDSTDGRDPATAASNHEKGRKTGRAVGSALVGVEDVSAQIGFCLVHVGLHDVSAPLGIPAVSAWRISSCAAMALRGARPHLARHGAGGARCASSTTRFAHGAVHEVAGMRLFDSYHCSRLNTNTGVLTAEMFRAVFAAARDYLAARR